MRLKKGIISIVLILAVIAGGLSVNQEKVQASDADLGFEPYATDYATPAKQETEWKTDGIYEYALIRNKTAIKLMIVKPQHTKKIIVPSQFHGLPVKELAFVDAGKAETLVISDGIEVIDHQAAKANPYLKKIHLGKDVQYIGSWAFAYNKRLQKVTGGEDVRFVGRCAFDGLIKMKNLPEFVYNGKNCKYYRAIFRNMKSLKKVVLPKDADYTLTMFKKCADLKYAEVKGAGFRINKRIWHAMLPEYINNEMFSDCRSLKTVKLYNGITKLNYGMFSGCVKLQKVNIPKKCTYIGINTFRNCKSLRKLTIPKSVKKIDKTAFRGCKKLTLYVKKGSYAHKYAKKYHIKYKLAK